MTVAGIPVKYMPKGGPNDEANAIQIAALVSDLMAKTKMTLSKVQARPEEKTTEPYTGPVTLRMRTKKDTELIVTDFVLNQYEYILVTTQDCNYERKAVAAEAEGEEEK